jgi:hypothetical protein
LNAPTGCHSAGMFLVHEHCNSTSAIDKYWLFTDAASAKSFFNSKIAGFKDFIDLDFYQELADDGSEDGEPAKKCTHEGVSEQLQADSSMDAYVGLTEDDYLVLTSIDSEGFGRRP